jgi:hypothetical protein
MKTVIVTLVVSLCLCGCYTDLNYQMTNDLSFEIRISRDKFFPTGFWVIGSSIKVKPWNKEVLAYVEPYCKIDTVSKEQEFSFRVHYLGEDWLNIQSLSFLVDSKVLSFSQEAGRTNTPGEYIENEVVQYVVPEDLIESLSSAKSVSIRVRGEKGNYDRDMPEWFQENMKRFYTLCTKSAGN